MMGIGAFFDFMRGKWGWAFAAALFAFLLVAKEDARHWRKMFDGEKARHQVTVANYRTAAEKARADDLANAAAVHAHYETIAKEKQHALETQLADARATAARYAERVRTTAANPGSGAGADMPSPANATGSTALPGGDTIIPVADLQICAVNTVIAKGWQQWWAEVSAQ